MFGMNKWYRVIFKAYRKNKLAEPYRSLLRYYFFLGSGTPIAHSDGHYDYFAFEKSDGSIGEATKNLQTLLPEHLFENYLSALEAYQSLGEDPEYEKVMAAFEKQDEYTFWHNEEITEILTAYVNEMKEKKIF